MMKKVFFALLIAATPVLAQAKPVTLDPFLSDSSSSSDDCSSQRCCPGPQGPIGPTGPQGFQGPKGDQGEPGEPGRPGARGPRGKEGCRGPRGHRGPRGRRGCQGATGAPAALAFGEFLNAPTTLGFTVFPGGTIPLLAGPLASPNVTSNGTAIFIFNSDPLAVHTYSLEYTVNSVVVSGVVALHQDGAVLPTSAQGSVVGGELVGQALVQVAAGTTSTITLQNDGLVNIVLNPIAGATGGVVPVVASAVVTQVN